MKKADLIALLLRMGVKKENAEKIAAQSPEDSTESFNLDELVTEWKTGQIALMKNEPSLVDEIRAAEMAKQRNIFEQKIKQTFGLTGEEIKDKKIDEIIAMAKEKAGAKSDKTTTELQEQILQLTNENKRLLEEEIPKIKNETVLHKKKFDINNKLIKLIPSEEGKLRNPFETVSKLVLGDLSEMYDVDTDDKGELVLFEKGKELKAKSKDGTKFLTAEEVINERLEYHKALVKSNAGAGAVAGTGQGKPGTVIIEGGEGDKKINAPGLSRAEQHAAEMKERAAAKAKP